MSDCRRTPTQRACFRNAGSDRSFFRTWHCDVAGATADEDDVELTEFSDEIEDWVIEEFAKIGLDTAKSILKQEVEDLVRRTDLEEETILDVMRILKEEFDS